MSETPDMQNKGIPQAAPEGEISTLEVNEEVMRETADPHEAFDPGPSCFISSAWWRSSRPAFIWGATMVISAPCPTWVTSRPNTWEARPWRTMRPSPRYQGLPFLPAAAPVATRQMAKASRVPSHRWWNPLMCWVSLRCWSRYCSMA